MKFDETAQTAASTSSPWVSPDGASLFVLSGASSGRVVRAPGQIGEKLAIGKSSKSGLLLADETVSRQHAELERTAAGLVLRDLDSRNGTWVGATRIREVLVDPGSLIRFGEVEVLVRVESDAAIIPPSAESRFGHALGKSLAMRRIFGLLQRIAPTGATVLLTGETGTGKDVLARSIHEASPRARSPFEVVDCSAITPSLIESELFGHERGAFTGAVEAHEGAFERAEGGTIFLDELGELPVSLQPKLLRVLENRQLRRVGGKRTIDVDVRVIAATTRDLASEVAQGTFRQDLYFRLAVVPARVPPLRDRPDDVIMLAEHLLGSVSPDLSLAPEAIAQLRSHTWPGNVRELRNVLERAGFLARASGERIVRYTGIEALGEQAEIPDADLFAFEEGTTYRDARARMESAFERRFVSWILARHGGNIAAAARAAKMDRKYLGDLARKHGLP